MTPPDANVTRLDPTKKRAPVKRKPTPAGDWTDLLLRTGGGAIKPTLGNVEIILRNDPALAGTFTHNLMSNDDERDGKPIGDVALGRLRSEIEARYRFPAPDIDTARAVSIVASESAYHPVRRYLEGLRWDGRFRLETMASDVFGADDTPLNRAYARRWAIGMVARAMEPGCKLDTALVLLGRQGAGKSSVFRALTTPWFVDTDVDLTSKDGYLQIGAGWCIEWGELASMKRASRELVKAFLSSSEDVFRPPYGRSIVRVPRTAVVVGTTNDDEPLRDPTGSRRFWPMRVGEVRVESAHRDRDQLWAEAREAFTSRDQSTRLPPWVLQPDEDALRENDAEQFAEEDPLADKVLEWARGKMPFTLHEAMEHGAGILGAQMTPSLTQRLSTALRAAGFERVRKRVGLGDREYRWRATPKV